MATVFLLDVDDTLLDNDAAKATLAAKIIGVGGEDLSGHFWKLYEQVRSEHGVVDYPETLARLHRVRPDAPTGIDAAVWGLPYEDFLYPRALDVVSELWALGTAVVLSDGDPLYQPMKIARAGITGAVRGNVLLFPHKEEHLRDVCAQYPAGRYVVVDDKAAILSRVKQHWGEHVMTVHVRQGHYAADPAPTEPDVSIASIGDLVSAVARSL